MSRQGRGWRRAGLALSLLAIVAFAVLAGERLTRGMAWRHTVVPPVEAGARRILSKTARILHIFRAAVTNDSVSLTPAQLRIATEHSPFRPVSEARRVEDLERRRVVETGATGVESRAQEVVASPSIVTPAPVPADAGTDRTIRTVVGKPMAWPPIRVSAIIGDRHSNGYIRVNGRLLTTGDSIDGVVVTVISNRSATLSCGGRSRVFYAGDGK